MAGQLFAALNKRPSYQMSPYNQLQSAIRKPRESCTPSPKKDENVQEPNNGNVGKVGPVAGTM